MSEFLLSTCHWDIAVKKLWRIRERPKLTLVDCLTRMPKPQIREKYSDTDSAMTENDECGEESEIPITSHVEQPCEDVEGKTR